MWKCWLDYSIDYVDPSNPKHHYRVVARVNDLNMYRQCICKLVSTIGDLLCGGRLRNKHLYPRNGRRKSWFGDQIWSKHLWGFYFHEKLKDILLYGRTLKGVALWHTTGQRYKF